MNVPLLLAPPAIALAVSIMPLAVASLRLRRSADKGTLVIQACLGVYVVYLCVLSISRSAQGVHGQYDAWLHIDDLDVSTSLDLKPLTSISLFVGWLTTSLCLRWRKASASANESQAAATGPLFALQGTLWLCALGSDLPISLSGFVLAGYALLTVQAGAVTPALHGRSLLPWSEFVIAAIHRAADALAFAAVLTWLLWVPSLSSAFVSQMLGNPDETLLAPIVGLAAGTWLVLLLSGALCLRTLAAFAFAQQERVSLAVAALVVGQSALWICCLVPHSLWFVPLTAVVVGITLAFALGHSAALTRTLRTVGVALRDVGLFISGLHRWVFATVLLQAPVVAVDACARVLKLVAGGDIQRYVAVGLLGLGALVFVSTRPAAPDGLTIRTDGLRVIAVALRGTASASKLLYDYDFDGDRQIDRVAAGPSAGFTYPAPGTYSVSVTIRDPFWHTQRTLHAKVWVHK